MTIQKQQKYRKTLSIVAGVMLLLAIPKIWPYGYFKILRWVVTGVAGFNTYTAFRFDRIAWVLVMGLIALLFNPITPIHLTKEIWIIIDLIVALLMFISVKAICKK